MTARALDRGFVLPAAGVGLAVGWAAARSPQLTLVAAAAAVVALLVLLHTEALLLALVAALPWEGALDWPSEKVSVVKLLGVLLCASWALRALGSRERLRLPAALVPALLVGATVVLALVVSPDPGAGVLDALRYALFIVFFFLIVQMARTRSDVRRIIEVFVLSGSAAAVWGVYAFVVLGRERAGGPIDDPNDFAYLLACLMPLAGYLVATQRARRLLWSLCFVALAAATLATLSRGALVGLGGVVIWGVATRRVPLGAVVAGVIAVASIAVLAFAAWGPAIHDRLENKQQIASSNVESRRALWTGALRMWADRPVTGVGPGRYAVEADRYVRNDPLAIRDPVVHNTYLQAVAETGALGLGAFLVFLAATWHLLTRASRRARAEADAEGRQLVTAIQATLLIAIVSACFLSVELTTPFWLIGALAVVVAGAHGSSTGRPAAAATA